MVFVWKDLSGWRELLSDNGSIDFTAPRVFWRGQGLQYCIQEIKKVDAVETSKS